MSVDKGAILEAYVEGVDAITAITNGFTAETWVKPTPCEGWAANDLAAHVRTVAGRYHRFLDAACAGHRRLLVPLAEMDRINAEEMVNLPDVSPSEHIEEFARLARSHADRVVNAWEVPIGIMDGFIPAGLALGVEAVEFNIHAWDFSKVAGKEYRPTGAQVMFDAAARAFVLSKASHGQAAVGLFQEAVHPLVRRLSGDPWAALLKRMGRSAVKR